MPTVIRDSLLILRHRAFVAMTLGMVLLPVALLSVVAIKVAAQPEYFALMLAIFVGAFGGFLVSFPLKEALAASPAWFVPRLRDRVVAVQLAWAGASFLVVLVLLRIVLGSGALGPAGLVSFAAIGAASFVGASLITYHLAYAAFLPYYLYFLFFFTRPRIVVAVATWLRAAITDPGIWVAAAVIALGILALDLRSARLHRRLAAEPVLSPLAAWRQQRLLDFASRRRVLALGRWPVYYGQRVERPVFGAGLLARVLERMAAATGTGARVAAASWRLVYLAYTQMIAREPLRFWGGLAGCLATIVVFGYIDSFKPMMFGHPSRWFAGFITAFVMYAVVGFDVLVRTTGTLIDRRLRERAGMRFLVVSETVVVGTTLALLALCALLELVLPAVRIGTTVYIYRLPPLHALLVPAAITPVLFWILAARGRSSRALIQAVAIEGFIVLHALATALPYRIALPVVGAIAVLGTGGFVLAWHHHCWRRDFAA